MSSYFGGKQCPKIIAHRFRFNHTRAVFGSFSKYFSIFGINNIMKTLNITRTKNVIHITNTINVMNIINIIDTLSAVIIVVPFVLLILLYFIQLAS